MTRSNQRDARASTRWAFLSFAVLTASACGSNGSEEATPAETDTGSSDDTGGLDTSATDSTLETSPDTSLEDSAPVDSGAALDTESPDTTTDDTTVVDTAVVDSTGVDTTVPDTMLVDTSIADTVLADTTVVDSTIADTGPWDTGAPDTGPWDTGSFDTGPWDTGPFDTGSADTGSADSGSIGCLPTIDLGVTALSGNVTLDGATLPGSSKSSDSIILYLRAQDTGVLHEIHRVTFGGSYPTYTRTSGTQVYSTKVPPGVYDLLFSRGYNATDTWTYKTDSTDSFVYGRRVLRTGVTIPSGSTTLDVDLKSATVSGSVTLGGAALPTTSKASDSIIFHLRAKDTGVLHEIHRVTFGGSYPTYTRSSGTESYSTKVPPGTYDLVFSRGYNTTDTWTYKTDPADGYAYGRRVLKTDVVVPAGPFTLDLELQATALTGTVTLDGASLPTTSKASDSIILYLKAQDTGVLHELHRVTFGGSYPTYTRTTGSEAISTKVPPGTYDLVFSRGYNATDTWTYKTDPADGFPYGRRVLKSAVVVPAFATTLDVDLKSTSLTGKVTVDGLTPPTTSKASDSIIFHLRAKDTGVLHEIHRVTFGGSYPTYTRTSGTENYNTKVPPGRYDVLFSRGYNTSDTWTYKTDPADGFTYGRRVLQADLDVPSGSFALDLDLKTSALTGSVTLDGGALPTTSKASDSIIFHLRAKDTGVLHEIHRVTFGGSYPTYTRTSGTESFSTKVPPGLYDLMFSRGYNATDTWTYKTDPTDAFVYGRRLLQTDVSVAPGTTSLNINLRSAPIAGTITLNGMTLPGTSKASDSIVFYLRATDTGVLHEIHRVTFGGSYPTYTRTTGADLFSTRIPPGTYDLLFSRGYNSTDTWTYKTDPTDGYAYGRRVIGVCTQP